MSSNSTSLQIEEISLSFGGTAVLSDIGFNVREGEIRAIIGPNGAGKTSMLNCISGFYRPQSGRVLFGDQDLTQVPAHKIASLGVARYR